MEGGRANEPKTASPVLSPSHVCGVEKGWAKSTRDFAIVETDLVSPSCGSDQSSCEDALSVSSIGRSRRGCDSNCCCRRLTMFLAKRNFVRERPEAFGLDHGGDLPAAGRNTNTERKQMHETQNRRLSSRPGGGQLKGEFLSCLGFGGVSFDVRSRTEQENALANDVLG